MTSTAPKRKVIHKTSAQIEVLEEFYQNGMTSYGKDHQEARKLLVEAVEQTGLSEGQVKVTMKVDICEN